ncbi:tetratricopeptide repeat protein [Rossellomorea vietnamensis]|uniref:Tetratricopeptide repeat protein n=1 Tax=Rossellomorea vietnamensis TaxID=218284 RepID=A0A5D4MC16_9BACI|nr:tetratricopeptide repeat protein [Rossellomorea vietnamensis]TYR99161.1 tetratricopeptide repeat protein [Rossellomorea vietnamensis]
MRKGSNARNDKSKILSFVPTGEYYFNKGIKAYHRRELNKSKKYLNRALQLEPLEPMIACQLSIVHTEMGEYTQSNQLLHLIVDSLDPHMTECHYFLANNYAHLGLFKEAYTHVTNYLEKEEYGEFSEDAEELLEILELDSDEALDTLYEHDELIANQDKARNLLESGNFQKAVDLLQEVIKDFPEYWSAYNNLALAYFYLGDTEKATATLEEVMEKNPGNLHALCNTAVFYFYQRRHEELQELVEGLEKIRPIHYEQRYKLGATFALIGRNEKAYEWLKSLQKLGFQGDASFYYWLSHSAYQTGHEQTAQQAWKRVLEENPEKAGMEPWNEENPQSEGFENHVSSILKKLKSDYAEERMFGLFLISVSRHQKEILTHTDFGAVDDFTLSEKLYLGEILNADSRKAIKSSKEIKHIHETAMELYQLHHPISAVDSGLFLTWFSIACKLLEAEKSLKNAKGCAAATEYIWHRLRGEKKTKTLISGKYGITAATLNKYLETVEVYLP